MVTGKSVLIKKQAGDEVIGATLNKTGNFQFRATRVGKNTFLAQVIRLVQQAQGSKAPIQRLADQVSGWFVPIVIAIALLTLMLWFLVMGNITLAMITMVEVLLIACPCAMGVSPAPSRNIHFCLWDEYVSGNGGSSSSAKCTEDYSSNSLSGSPLQL